MSETLSDLALKYAPIYRGKVEIVPKVPIRGLDDFSVWYTPGVAAVSEAIKNDEDLSFEYTWRWNTVAIVTDGSRVLGLGDIGPEGAMPVMEGKALIFKYLGGVDAIPLPIRASTADDMVHLVKQLEPAFGGINLEDIASPKCFEILRRLRNEMNIPVWHDDQQGTAGVVLAALINALKLTGRKLHGTRIVLFGAGAANIATAQLLMAAGASPGDLILVDSRGILHPERKDIDELLLKHPWKYELAIKTNRDRLSGDASVALDGSDVLIAASSPGPGLIKREWVARMNKDAVVFSLANPIPEIWPWEAREAGAKIVATGRSDFPNQVNNSLLFPSIFRGILDVAAKTVTDSMVIAAAEELARFAQEKGIREDYIIPSMEEWEAYPRVASIVGEAAAREGLARRPLSREEILERATAIIVRSKKLFKYLLDPKMVL